MYVFLHVFSLGPHTDLNLFLWKQHWNYCGHTLWFFLKKTKQKNIHPWFQRAFYPSLIFYKLKKESTTSSSNKRTKTFCRDYLHCIAKSAIFSKQIISNKTTPTECRKQILKFIWKYCRNYCWNETDDEILLHNFSELWNLFSLVYGLEIVFGVNPDNCLYL